MDLDIALIVLIPILGTLLYKYATRNFNYWKDRGIPYAKPLPLFGNILEVVAIRKQIGHFLADLYKQFKYPFFGIFIFNKPYLIIKDPELIKLIMVRDFNYFTDHTTLSDNECDPLTTKFLFFLKNPEWKIIRKKVTSAFSSGKIKSMVNSINEIADEMIIYLNKNLKHDSLEAKEFCTKFTTDVITSCIFGVQAHSFQFENATFRMIGKKMFDSNYATSLRQAFYFVWHDLIKLLKLPFLDKSVTDFMREVFWKILQERENGNYKRNDFIDILIDIKRAWTEENNMKYEGDIVIAQAGMFFLAGFETVSSTIAFALYELCLNKEIQNKVRVEVLHVLSNHGKFTFEAVQDMKYLQMVICETLRKYPVLPFLDRTCLEDYKIPDSNFVIEKGTPVYIPMFGLHYDPKYFPNPEEFIPERFAEENDVIYFDVAYMPFGKGPRKCIGARFGSTIVQLGLAHILSTFEVEKSKDTPVPLKYHTKGIALASTVGLPMRFKKVDIESKLDI